MTAPACSLNSSEWWVGDDCPRCGHTRLVHPGGSAGDLRACVLCELANRIPTPVVRLREQLARGTGSAP